MAENTIEMKFRCPLEFVVIPDDVDKDCFEVSARHFSEYAGEINKLIIDSFGIYDPSECGLAAYLIDDDLAEKITKIIPSVENINGELLGLMTVTSREELTDPEKETLRKELIRQLDSGWGDEIAEEFVTVGGNDVYISFLCAKDGEKLRVISADEEINLLIWEKQTVSKIHGAAHLCGHDGHTAMLLICGAILKKLSDRLDGKVLLCFERAEEGGGPDHAYGVYPLLKYMEDNKIRIDKCFALHVNPELESGKISAEAGGVMAGSFGFEIHIKGKGGHGSRPDLANNPLDCFCDFYETLCKTAMRSIDPYKLITFSVPLVRMGEYNNVISDELYFSGTARSLDRESLETFRKAFINQLEHLTAAYGCSYSTDSIYIESPLCNDEECSERIKKTVERYLGKEQYLSCKANLGSESFAHYVDKYSGALAFLGIKNNEAGSGSPLHSSCFDLDENALKYGVGVLAGFALDELKK